MTKPPGSAPTPRENHPASRSFCGQPIVVRVRDLNWQPPAPAAGEDTWVSTLLGEDLLESQPSESLLEGLGETASTTAPEASFAEPPLKSAPTGSPTGSEEPMPSYLHRSTDSRGQRRHSAISGQWLNRLYLGGMAVSLLVASYWVLGGGSSEESTKEVPGDLFAETGDSEAPPWSGLEPSLTPHEAITVQPLESDVPRMASRPERTATALPQNPAEVELPTIQPAYTGQPSYTGLPSLPPEGSNPTWSNTTGKPAMADDDYIPSFGPSSRATSLDDDYAPSYSGGIPTGNNLPDFDANPASRTASSPSSGSSPRYAAGNGYPEADSSDSDQGHWMFSNGRELVQRNRPTSEDSDSQPESKQYTQIINGRSDDVALPQINTPPQMAESAGQYSVPQDPNQYGFGPYSDPYADPYSQQDSAPRSASRTGLTGDIETFSGTR